MHRVKSAIVQEGIRYTEDGDLIIPVIGQPYGSADARDLTKDFFHEKTDFGPLDKVLSYFDHQNDEQYVEKGIGLGKRPVGYSVLTGTVPEGRKWDIVYQLKSIPAAHLDKNTMDAAEFEQAIKDRRMKYLKVIEKAARDGLLEASSIAYDRVDDPNVEGKIDEWDTVGMDLTPTNADTRAHVIKSIQIGGEEMPTEEELKAAEEKKKQDDDAAIAAKAKADADAKAAAEAAAAKAKADAEAAKNPVIEQINSEFDKLENKDNPAVTPAPQIAALTEQVAELQKSVKTLTDFITLELAKITGSGEESIASMVKKSVAESLNTQQALGPLGVRIAKFVKGDASAFLQLDKEQEDMLRRKKALDDNKKNSNGFDSHAPGSY